MKQKKQKLIAMTFFLATWSVAGQGTLVFDQNSTNIIEGASFLGGQPMGQSTISNPRLKADLVR
jgi:hypothetical protein